MTTNYFQVLESHTNYTVITIFKKLYNAQKYIENTDYKIKSIESDF